MLLVALILAQYSSGRALPFLAVGASQFSSQSAEAGRQGVIVLPIPFPTATAVGHRPIHYLTKRGDTLQGIAASFHVSVGDIVWSNPGLIYPLGSGRLLHVPPVPGIVAVVKKGDTPASLAAALGVDSSSIIDFNYLTSSELLPGMEIIVPGGRGKGRLLGDGALADPVAPGELLCPLRDTSVLQPFGPTSFALEPSFDGYRHFHTGIDLSGGYGTPIVAAAGGRVSATGYDGGFGIRVQVADTLGQVETYAHMSELSTKPGASVQQGETIGYVGSTGLSTGPHLHLQLEIAGQPVNPAPLVGC